MALGASSLDVSAMVIRQGVRVAAFGLAPGRVASMAVAGPLAGLLFEVEPTDPVVLATVVLTLAAVVGLATWIPARRATRVDPATAPRAD